MALTAWDRELGTTQGRKVLEILSPVLLAALTWAAAKLAQLIRAKVQNEYLKGVLVGLDDAVSPR